METIVGKAQEKEKSSRYPSAAALADDIERYLNDQPIAARPPSASYQAQKFAGRHRALVVGTAAVAVALLVGTAVSAFKAVQARRAERIANAVNAFLQDDLLSALGERHPDTPASMELVAEIERVLGRCREAEQYADVARLRTEVLGGSHKDTLKSLDGLANVYLYLDKYSQAVERNTRLLDIRQRVPGPEHPDTMLSTQSLALAYHSDGRGEPAESSFVDVLAWQRRPGGCSIRSSTCDAAEHAVRQCSGGPRGRLPDRPRRLLDGRSVRASWTALAPASRTRPSPPPWA